MHRARRLGGDRDRERPPVRTSVERRRGELERAVRGLEATTAIARAVGGETELERVLELIVKRGRALCEAHDRALLLREGDELVVAAGAGAGRRRRVGAGCRSRARWRARCCDAGRASGSPTSRPAAGSAPSAWAVGAATALLVPLVFRGRALGVLAAFDRLRDEPRSSATTSTLLRRSPPAPRPPSPPRRRSRPTACAARSSGRARARALGARAARRDAAGAGRAAGAARSGAAAADDPASASSAAIARGGRADRAARSQTCAR